MNNSNSFQTYFKTQDLPKVVNFIYSWLNTFLKHKHIYDKYLIEKLNNKLIVKDGQEIKKSYLIDPFFIKTEKTISKLAKEKKMFFIVVLNSEDNKKKMYELWKQFKKIPKLNLLFVNPLSKTAKKWAINPSTHDSLSYGKIKIGINTISENIELIDYSYIKQVFN